jgi:hypothetical protein
MRMNSLIYNSTLLRSVENMTERMETECWIFIREREMSHRPVIAREIEKEGVAIILNACVRSSGEPSRES